MIVVVPCGLLSFCVCGGRGQLLTGIVVLAVVKVSYSRVIVGWEIQEQALDMRDSGYCEMYIGRYGMYVVVYLV